MMRISDEEVIDAYAETAYRPQTQSWINTITMECDPLSAILMASHTVTEDYIERSISSKNPWGSICAMAGLLGLSPSYVLGFSTGFDDAEQAEVIDQFEDKDLDCDDFVEGFKDGKRININVGP